VAPAKEKKEKEAAAVLLLKTLEDISCIIESPKRNRRYTRPRI
jgi:hypothetical protein